MPLGQSNVLIFRMRIIKRDQNDTYLEI